jgi:hypothetical protein
MDGTFNFPEPTVVTNVAIRGRETLIGNLKMSATAVRNMFRSHPDHPSHAEVMSHCIEACFACVETCTACADACLAEKNVEKLISCIRLNQDCAAVTTAMGSILSRANKVGHRQLLEAQLTTCIAFCRACATECERHAATHKHCAVCAKVCNECVSACNEMLSSMRMPA